MAKCNHKFVIIGEVVKYPIEHTNAGQYNKPAVRPRMGIKVMCAECGEIRGLYDDGSIDIIHDPTNR